MQISGNRCILTFKIIGIFVLSGLLVIQTIQCVTKFISSPTYVSTKYVELKFSDFPAISMCPSGSIYKSEVLASHGIPNIKAYNYKYDLTWSSNNSNTSPTELFNQITYDFSELVDKINIRYLKSDVVRVKSILVHLKYFCYNFISIIRLPNIHLIPIKQKN